MVNLQTVKQRFGIIGLTEGINRALKKALRVAETDISVLISGESGVGKEAIPKIIHQFSHRKHSKYIAVNCGAIPEGTIDSELFGHEKGAFTGATSTRSGYFESADGGTIFLDEVGELPLPTQIRLLRVLETGEFLKVGSSKVQKTNVRIVAATNVKMIEAIKKGKIREDLYYRLSTVEIHLPPLRERKEDIPLLFRKFASDFALKYKMPPLKLSEEAVLLLINYNWYGNIRQLRNVAEQVSVLEQSRDISAQTLAKYLPKMGSLLPAVVPASESQNSDFASEREILYKILFDMKKDLNDLKNLTHEIIKNNTSDYSKEEKEMLINKLHNISDNEVENIRQTLPEQPVTLISKEKNQDNSDENKFDYAETINEEQSLSLANSELELIKKALEKNKWKKNLAAKDLGISERTLYRKIKHYDLSKDEY